MIPGASDNVPQLVPQAVAPTSIARVQGSGSQEARSQDGTDRGGEEVTILTTFIAPTPQYGTF